MCELTWNDPARGGEITWNDPARGGEITWNDPARGGEITWNDPAPIRSITKKNLYTLLKLFRSKHDMISSFIPFLCQTLENMR